MMTSRLRYVALALALLSTAGLGGCAGGSAGNNGDGVSVFGPWLGAEQQQFQKVLDAFRDRTGVRVHYEGTRAMSQVLTSNIQAGTPPDIAVLSGPGDLATYANNGHIYPLDTVLAPADKDAFPRSWLLPVGQHIYTVPIKANLKSIIWYDPHQLPTPPATRQDLLKLGRPRPGQAAIWCAGVADAPSSGWPGSDILEDILLRGSANGPDNYRKWANGTLAWTSPAVKAAWDGWRRLSPQTFTTSGARTALFTDFADAGRPMFTDPPGCLLDHQASFITGFYARYDGAPQPGKDFDFFSLPATPPGSRAPWVASADLAGMFNDTPNARRLMSFLSTAEAQKIWPGIPDSSAFTVDRRVDASVYRDDVSKRIAAILATGDVCLDAADVMPGAMRSAFYRAVLEYLNNPDGLGALLTELDAVQKGVPKAEWVDLECG